MTALLPKTLATRGGVAAFAQVATLIALATLLAGSMPAAAATVEIAVVDANRSALGDLAIVLNPLADAAGSTRFGPDRIRQARTGATGIAHFLEVPIGTYEVVAQAPPAAGFVSFYWSLNSPDPSRRALMMPAPRLTVARADEELKSEIVLQRGDRIRCTLEIDRQHYPVGTVHMLDTISGIEASAAISDRDNGYIERLLPPGRWEVWLEGPSVILRSFTQDGAEVLGPRTTVDVTGDGRQVALVWSYMAPCLVTGALSWDKGDHPPCGVVARLQRPGSWDRTVLSRSVANLDTVPASKMDGEGHFEILLLDGTWRIQPEGPSIVSSDPPYADILLEPGQETNQDFRVTVKEGAEAGPQSQLVVSVQAPNGAAVQGAVVSVWKLGTEKTESEPLARKKTEPGYFAMATFRGLPKGDYLVAASHEKQTEGSAEVLEFEAVPEKSRHVTITLGDGAVVRVAAKDAKGAPIVGAALSVDYLGTPPTSLVRDPDLTGRRMHRRVLTDESGRAAVQGLDSGRYELTPSLGNLRDRTHFLRIRSGGAPPAKSVELTLADGDKAEVEITFAAAASFTAKLACADRGPLPPKASVRLYDANLDLSGEEAEPIREKEDEPPGTGAPLSAEASTRAEAHPRGILHSEVDIPLTGQDRDLLAVGPLIGGEYQVAVRPREFDRWTFAPGTEDRAKAVPRSFDEGRGVDLGLIEIDCGPSIAVVPVIASGDPLPDLHATKVEPELLTRPAASEAKARALPRPRVELSARSIRLRGMPEGDAVLSLVVSHPLLIPGQIRIESYPVALVRGREAVVHLPVTRIGGAIQIAASLGAASATLVAPDGKVRQAALGSDGQLGIGSLEPGIYSLQIFSDAAGRQLLRSWDDVRVEAGRITQI